jgi:hypothetical protein
VNPDEPVRIELLLDRAQRLMLQIFLAVDDKRDVVVLCLNVVDPVDAENVHLRTISNQHAVQHTARIAPDQRIDTGDFGGPAEFRARSIQRFAESLGAERLLQIVERMHLESA